MFEALFWDYKNEGFDKKIRKNRVQGLKVHFMSLIRFILNYVTLALAQPNIYPSFTTSTRSPNTCPSLPSRLVVCHHSLEHIH